MNTVRTHISITALLAICGCVSLAKAQEYPVESELRYEVWNGSSWGSSVVARPGGRVEMRVVVSYTGSAAVRGLGQVLYQPIFSNSDNEGPSVDNIGAWRNGGVGSNTIGGLLSRAEGQSGEALASYGRVGFGVIGTTSANMNVLTSFRHSGGSNGAPEGSWLRLAGSFCSAWPVSGEGTVTVDEMNNILRGVSSVQITDPNQGTNPYWVGDTTDIVVFRQAIFLSDLAQSRAIDIFSEQSSLDRRGRPSGLLMYDNRRFMQWFAAGDSRQTGSIRTGVAITPAQIIITPNIPAPSAAIMLALGGAVVARRRR